jgi:hypothetical protein
MRGATAEPEEYAPQGLTRTLDEATLISDLSRYPFGSRSSEAITSQTVAKKAKDNATQISLRSKGMRLKLSGNFREVSERRQVGDAEEMMDETKNAWWRNVTMEEGV